MNKRVVHTCVLVADAARARFFEVRRPRDDDYGAGPRLRECDALVNPEGQLTGRQTYANTKSGRRHAPATGSAHGTDDHRAGHDEEVERRFAKRILALAAELADARRLRRLVVIAAPRMLGLLRDAAGAQLPEDLAIEEIDRNVSWHAVARIEELLEQRGLLRPRAIDPDKVYRPSGQPPPASR